MREEFYVPYSSTLPVISQQLFIVYVLLLLKIANGSAFFTFLLVSFCLLLNLFISSLCLSISLALSASYNAIKKEGESRATR